MFFSRRARVELSSHIICLLFLFFSAFINDSLIFFCKEDSSSRLFLALVLENLTVNPLISILTRSHFKPKSSTSRYFSIKCIKLSRKSEMYCLSSRRE